MREIDPLTFVNAGLVLLMATILAALGWAFRRRLRGASDRTFFFLTAVTFAFLWLAGIRVPYFFLSKDCGINDLNDNPLARYLWENLAYSFGVEGVFLTVALVNGLIYGSLIGACAILVRRWRRG